jgi:ParB/RepB/Spo0J family partition protein
LETALEIDQGSNRLAEAREIAVEQVHPNPKQPRQWFDDDSLQELAASIREQGVLQPITVIPDEEGYRIVAGERRWRAARIAGLKRIPALVRNLSDRDQRVIALMENLQREDLNDMDRARGLADLRDALGTQVPDHASHELDEVVGHRLGISGRAVRNFIALLSLPPSIQTTIASGTLTEKHGRALRRISEPETQRQVAEVATRLRLTGDETVKLARALQERPSENIDLLAWHIKAGETPAVSKGPKKEEEGQSTPSSPKAGALDEVLRHLDAQIHRLETEPLYPQLPIPDAVQNRMRSLSERLLRITLTLSGETIDDFLSGEVLAPSDVP